MAEQEIYEASALPENNTAFSKANLSKLFKAIHGLDFEAFHTEEQVTPDMTVKVWGARFIVNTVYTEFSLDANKDVTTTNSGTFTAPTGNPRIDLLYYNVLTPGLGITTGAESASPAAPAIPDPQIKLPIALIYHRVGSTKILNNDDSTNSYIMGRNVRPFLNIGGGASNTIDGISNPGADIDFKSNDSSITITPNDTSNDIDFVAGAKSLNPPGAIIAYGGATAPSGWLLCDGATGLDSVTDTSLADLFAVIGTTFGGTGASDFDLPDLRGRFPLGKDNMGGASANRVTDSQADNLGQGNGNEAALIQHNHSHSHSHSHSINMGSSSGAGSLVKDGNTSTSSQNTGSNATVDATNAGSGSSSMNPYLTVNYIISK